MESRRFGAKYVIRLDKGEEIVETLTKFCKEKNIRLGMIIGIGAVNDVTIGYFDPETKRYRSKKLSGNFEVIPLIGDVSTMKGEPYLHLHISLADKHLKTTAGHLNSATVSTTLEITLSSIDGTVEREFKEDIGLNLYKFP